MRQIIIQYVQSRILSST